MIPKRDIIEKSSILRRRTKEKETHEWILRSSVNAEIEKLYWQTKFIQGVLLTWILRRRIIYLVTSEIKTTHVAQSFVVSLSPWSHSLLRLCQKSKWQFPFASKLLTKIWNPTCVCHKRKRDSVDLSRVLMYSVRVST